MSRWNCHAQRLSCFSLCQLFGFHFTPLFGIRRPGVQLTPIHHEYARARAVHREIACRIAITGGVLVLPVVAYYGVPVILEMPEIGSFLVSEESCAKLYDLCPHPILSKLILGWQHPEQSKQTRQSNRRKAGPSTWFPLMPSP
jgi:hypothetical protein